MADRSTILIEIDADADGLQRESKAAGKALRGLGDEAQRAARRGDALSAMARKQKQSLGELQHVATRLTQGLAVATAAVGTHIIKTGAEFEQQMARVRAVTSASDQQMARLTKTAARLGAETKFSAGQAAAAMYELSSAGFSVDETIKALPGTMSLAAASGIELKDAAEISANALRGFRLDAGKSGHVADVLAKAVASSSLEMNDLQFSMKYIGPIASTTGQSLEAMTAALSLMADAGIKGEQAGTTLRGALVRLTAPTKSVYEGLGALHLGAKDLTGPDGLKPLAEIIATVEKSSRGMDKASRNAALAQVFGTEALSGMVAVIDQGAPRLERLTRAYERSDGAAKKSADTMNRTVKGAFENLTGSIETVEIALFQQFQEPLRKALLEGAALVNTEGKKIGDFFERVTGSAEFENADLAGQLRIILREAGDEVEKLDLPERLGSAFSAAIPHIAEAMKDGGIAAAKAFGEGFVNSSPLGRVVLASWLLNKTGGFAAFNAGGAKAGASMADGMKASMKSAAPGIALVVAAAFGPELLKEIKGRGGMEDVAGALGGELASKLGPRLEELTKDRDLAGLQSLRAELDKLADSSDAIAKSPGFVKFRGEVQDAIDATGDLASAFANMQRRTTSSMKDISAQVRLNMRVIRRTTESGSLESKEAFARNFREAAAAVQRSMDAGVISTKEGMAQINALMRRALAQFGISGKEASRYLSGADTKTGKSDEGAATGIPGAARGGFFLGNPGASARDGVPMMVNGQPVLAAEGEYVGIFNRHQRKQLDSRLSDRGGLAGFMQGHRPHHMAGGGVVTGDTDYVPALGSALRRMSAATHTPISVTSGRRTMGEQIAAVQKHGLYGPNNPTGAAAPSPNAPHVRGVAADISPGRERFGGVAGRFGLGFTVPTESWHIEILRGAVASGKISGGEAQRLARVLWSGPGGAVGQAGQAGLDRVRAAAQRKLDRLASGGGASTGAIVAAGGGMLSGPTASASAAARPKTKKPAKSRKRTARTPLVTALSTSLKGGVFDRIRALAGGDSSGGLVNAKEALLSQMTREHQRSDEDAMLGALDDRNPDGTYKLTQEQADVQFAAIVKAHLAELGGEYGIADTIAGYYDGPRGLVASRASAVGVLTHGIVERQQRQREIIDKAKANAEAIRQLQKRHDRKGASKKQKAALKRQIDALRDDRKRLVGSRSITDSLSGAGGLLGATRDGMGAFAEALPGMRMALETDRSEAINRRGDRQDISDEITAWGGRAPSSRDGGAGAGEDPNADIFRQQRDEALKTAATSEALFGVFQGFAPLLGQRLVGAFAQGGRIPETGLALVHRDETVIPDPAGGYGLEQRTGAPPSVTVQLTLAGDSSSLVRLVDARVDGRAAKVVSEQIGRRQRMLTMAPGGS